MSRDGRVPIAWRALADKKARTAVAAGGIAFAIVFMFMQLGFRGAVEATATAISSRIAGEVVLVSQRFVHLNASGSIPRARLYQALAEPRVEHVVPLYIDTCRLKAVGTRRRCRLIALGIRLGEPSPLDLPELDAELDATRPSNTVLVDRWCQAKCGALANGDEPTVRDTPVTVVGRFTLGTGFVGDGALVASDETYARLVDTTLSNVDVGVVRLRPGADPETTGRALRALLPADTRVLTTAELERVQLQHWLSNTSLGNIFSLGTLVGFFVGLVVLYQVLSTDITNQLPAYATLKAMGFADRRLHAIVLEQSLAFAVLGYVPGALLSTVLYAVVRWLAGIPMVMTPRRALLVLGLSVLMCAISGAFALRKISLADPADLY